MREKLGSKLKLEVELDFRKIAGVLSCIYSQGEQKKCLSHGSTRLLLVQKRSVLSRSAGLPPEECADS